MLYLKRWLSVIILITIYCVYFDNTVLALIVRNIHPIPLAKFNRRNDKALKVLMFFTSVYFSDGLFCPFLFIVVLISYFRAVIIKLFSFFTLCIHCFYNKLHIII